MNSTQNNSPPPDNDRHNTTPQGSTAVTAAITAPPQSGQGSGPRVDPRTVEEKAKVIFSLLDENELNSIVETLEHHENNLESIVFNRKLQGRACLALLLLASLCQDEAERG